MSHQDFNIGSLFFMGISGLTLTTEEEQFIKTNKIGGIILFTRNFSDPKQLKDLCKQINQINPHILISVDMEGGRVARFKEHFTVWPPMAKLAAHDSPQLAFEFALSLAKELRAAGIHLNYAPCLDILTNSDNEVIGDRSFGSDHETVGKFGSAIIRGFKKAPLISCVKHFPGHGAVSADSHFDLPVDQRELKDFEENEWPMYKKTFKAKVETLMTAHILYPKIDPQWPATLSEVFLKKILLEQLNYQGLIFSDDLDMKALAKWGDQTVLAPRALEAGCDILLYCNNQDSLEEGLLAVQKKSQDSKGFHASLEQKYQKFSSFKKEFFSNWNTSAMPPISVIGCDEHSEICRKILEGAKKNEVVV